MWIKYNDSLGVICEMVDEYGISFNGGMAYFNNKKLPVEYILEIYNTEEIEIPF